MATYVNGASLAIPATLPSAVANGNFFRGEMTLIAGLPKTGKSQLAAHIAAVVSAGKDFAPNVPCDPTMKGKRVLIINGERGLQYAPGPRCIAAGADMTKIEFVDASADGVQTLEDCERVIRQCYKFDLALVMLDPLGSFMPPWGNNATRRAIGPLLELSKQRNFAMVGFHHTNTKAGKVVHKASPVALIKGNTEIPNMLVSTWMMAKTDKGTVLEEMICNLRGAGTRYNFVIEGVKLPGMLPTSRLVMTGESEVTLEDALMTRPKLNAGINGDRNHWLLSLLAERGQLPADEICKQGANKGYSRDMLRRSREELGIPSRKLGDSWFWGDPIVPPLVDDLEETVS
jgi:putative DNA primase/helicase